MAGNNSTGGPAPLISSLSRRQWTIVCFVIGLVLFAISGWLWYTKLYSTPQRVFWGMINNGLSTRGVTRVIDESAEGGSSKQIIRLSFNGDTRSYSLADITQQGAGAINAITTQTIGTNTADYISYTKISPDDGRFKEVLGVWGKTNEDGEDVSQRSNFLLESLFGLVPIANLNPTERQRLVNQLQDNKVYDVDYSKLVYKTVRGRSAIVYPVKLNLAAYVSMLNGYLKILGVQNTNEINASNYEGQSASLSLAVDKMSHQLLTLSYDNSNRTEAYGNYGVVSLEGLPLNTVSVNELQTRLQKTLQQTQ